MADITNPEVTNFLETLIRPVSEQLKQADDNGQTSITVYFASISALIAGNDDADLILDSNSGIRPVTKANLVNFITLLQDIDTAMSVAGKRDVNLVPVVRLNR